MNTEDTYTPLDGTERVKLIIYFVLLIITVVAAGAGAIPALGIIASLYIMKKDSNYIFFRKAQGFIIGYFWLFAAASVIIGIIAAFFNGEYILFGILTALPAIAMGILTEKFFYNIIYKHRMWIIENGIFAEKENEQSMMDKISDKVIQKSSEQRPDVALDAANAILKYKELLDDGLITQEQFEKKRDELFK
jgi:hypothetical protein